MVHPRMMNLLLHPRINQILRSHSSDDETKVMDDIPQLRNTSKEFQALFGYPNAFKIGKDNQAFEVDQELKETLKQKACRFRSKMSRGSLSTTSAGERRTSLSSEPDTMASLRRLQRREKSRPGKERPLSTVSLPGQPESGNDNCNNNNHPSGPGFCRKVIAIRDYTPKSDGEIALKKGKSVMLLRLPDFHTSTMAYGYKRATMGRSKYGYFPANYVTPIYDLILVPPPPNDRD